MYEIELLGFQSASSLKPFIRLSLLSLGENVKHGLRFPKVSAKDIILNLKRVTICTPHRSAWGKSEWVKHLVKNKL